MNATRVNERHNRKTAELRNVAAVIAMATVFLIMLTSCVQKPVAETRYLNVDSVLQAQKKILSAAHTLLTREIRLDDKTVRDSSRNLDSAGWATELDEFSRLAAINKPTYTGTFTIEDGLQDANSNLKVKAFINRKNLPIKYVKLYYQNDPFRLRKIESFYAEGDKNPLYKTSRILLLEFRDVYNKTILASYSITGGQKIVAGDTIEFSIRGRVTIE